MNDAPLAYSIAEAARKVGISRAQIYLMINAGELVARKRGRRTVITAGDLQAFVDALPRVPAKAS